VFNGREPDEDRWDFDPIKLDSYSGRVTVNPTDHWSLAAGYGYLKSPEALNPSESMHRITASVLHGARLGIDGQWASAFIWGANKHSAQPGWSNGFLAESEAIIDKHNTLFGRTKLVQKSAADLAVDNPVTLRSGTVLPGFAASQSFNIGALQLGYIRERDSQFRSCCAGAILRFQKSDGFVRLRANAPLSFKPILDAREGHGWNANEA
jgi:hypothetical protein